MGNLLKYSGIVTKIRAMEAKLLTPEQFADIANLRSVPDIADYLRKNTAYAEVLDTLTEDQIHRGNIEKVLVQSLYHDYTKIYRFCGQSQREFMKLIMKGYEIELINYCLRIVINHYKKPFDLNYKSAFDYNLALDLYYYTSTWKEQKKILKKSDLELFMRDRGSKIDLLNIQWIYRAKKYYNMKPADIYLMLIPIHYKLSTELVKDMVEAPGVEEFENVVIRTTYARHYNFKQNLTMEQMYADCLHHLYTADRRKNPYSVSAINTYLFLKEEELKKLTTVMECVRYGLNPGETAAYIGGRTR